MPPPPLPAPPPEPPSLPFLGGPLGSEGLSSAAPPPPPVDVIVENTEFDPLPPSVEELPADPPAPTEIGKVVAVTVIPVVVLAGEAV